MSFAQFGITLLGDKVGLDAFEQVALIAFKRTEVVILTLND